MAKKRLIKKTAKQHERLKMEYKRLKNTMKNRDLYEM